MKRVIFQGLAMSSRVFRSAALLCAILVAGCAPSQADVERSIRNEMKSTLDVVIASIDLQKQGDGVYLGTATAENGDVYDVTTTPTKDNKVEWNAIPGQATVERLVRAGLETQLASKVTSLQLTKRGPGDYTGPAELASGVKVIVSTRMEGPQLLWEAKPAP
jgi:hypothetical protein